MARKSKLNEERAQKIIELIEEGAYAAQAARAAGIGERTFYRWLEHGEAAADSCESWDEDVQTWNDLSDRQRRALPDLRPDWFRAPDENQYLLWQFWQGVKKAEASAELQAVGVVRQAAAEGTWQAASWYLERKFPERWARRDKTVHEGSVSHQHQHQLLPTGPEQIEEARRRLASARALSSPSHAPQLPEESSVIEAEVLQQSSTEEKESSAERKKSSAEKKKSSRQKKSEEDQAGANGKK